MPFLRQIIVICVLCITLPAWAQDATKSTVELRKLDGAVISVDAKMLSDLPPFEKTVTFMTSKGPQTGHYKGALLWELLNTRDLFVGLAHNEVLKHTVLITGRDGYQIVFSIGEIQPEFGNNNMMIAVEVDGKPIAEGMRIVVPGDQRGARNIRDVVRIELH